MNYRECLNKFINEMGYLKNQDVEGIIFYGSFHTNTYNEFSDIDLMILFNDDSDANQIKGYKTINGIQIEYFERTISKIYERANSDYMKCEDSLVSIVAFGEVVFDRNGKVQDLIEYINEKYSRPLPKYTKHEAIYQILGLKKAVLGVEELRIQNDPYFESYYFLTIERIRDFYHKLEGFSNLPQTKVCKLYNSKKLQEVQHKKIPEKEFLNLYFSSIEEGTNKEEKIIRINKLYDYATRNYNINFDDIRIDLGRKRY